MRFNPLCLLLTAAGMYLLVKLRFFYIVHPLRTAKKAFASFKGTSVIQSLMLALAGTLGVGNVFGVCLGIIIGGEGSVFWMFISVIFSSVLKYCEVVLSHDNLSHGEDGVHGSMFYILISAFKRIGGFLAFLYASFCLMLSLSMGAALQSGTASETIVDLFDTPPVLFGIIFTIVILFSIVKGVKIIEKITLAAIPLATIVYIFVTVALITVNFDNIGSVTVRIISDAFSPMSLGGGIIPFLMSRGIREGYSRGILSNEAGCGTSTMAHSRSGILNPASAGLMGIIEVVFDTGVLCMLTAFAVLTSISDTSIYTTGMALILDAVENTLGSSYTYAILISVIIFAYSTVVCWYFYGSECFTFIFGKTRKILFLPIFISAVFFGTVADNYFLVALTDIFIFALAILSVSALIKKSDRIKLLSEKGGVLPKRKLKIKIKGNGFSKEELRQGARAYFRYHSR